MAFVFAAASEHCCGSVRSQGTMIASAPADLTDLATGSIAAKSRPTSASRAPSAAKASVIAAPIPLAGPVIIATRPLSFNSIVTPLQRDVSLNCPSARKQSGRVGENSEQLFRQLIRRRQKIRRKDLADRRSTWQIVGLDQNVDRPLQPGDINVADPDFGDFGMVHFVLERRIQPLTLNRGFDQRLALGDSCNCGIGIFESVF